MYYKSRPKASDGEAMNESALLKKYHQLVAKLPTRSPIFLPTEKIPLMERIAGVERVLEIYRQSLESTYRPRLRALREKYKGYDRCFIIGNGPSLNLTDLSVLKNEVTFAVNGFFLKMPDLCWVPTFYVVEDHLVAEDRQKWINEFKGPTKLFPIYLRYCLEEGEDTIFYNHRPRPSYPDGFDFSTDAAEITYTGCTVTYSCLQLAFYLGFKKIYLIGVDASYNIPQDAQEDEGYGVGVLDMKSDDPNHFHPDYFGKGFRWHNPQVNKMVEAYKEADRTVHQSGQRIYNATIGGKLEVFQRVSFNTIFPHAKTPQEFERLNSINESGSATNNSNGTLPQGPSVEFGSVLGMEGSKQKEFPRLLLFDITRIGDCTATGEIKKNLFQGWPTEKLLQIYSQGSGRIGCAEPGLSQQRTVQPADVPGIVKDFKPEMILYRPVPNSRMLHELAMSTIWELNLPLVTWTMDDWPTLIAQTEGPSDFMLDDYHTLLRRAVLNLSISQAMADEFAHRYGVPFEPYANGVDPNDWHCERKPRDVNDAIVVRYLGSLDENMSLQSLVDIGKAIEKAAEEFSVRFEIKTRQLWYEKAKPYFNGLSSVRFITDDLSSRAYRELLIDSDIVVIANNFDEDSKKYLKYSIANKLPECLASGAAVLAYGPRGVATMDYLAEVECTKLVDTPGIEALNHAIRELLSNRGLRVDLGEKARRVAFASHNLKDLRSRFHENLKAIAGPGVVKKKSSGFEMVEFPRSLHAHIDEAGLVAHLFKAKRRGSVMIDVGAHFGHSARPFADLEWKVVCHEPDPNNRKQLQANLGDRPNVEIDPRAVGEKAETDRAFFSSEESTGISGMMAFRETHREVARVQVTTVDKSIQDKSIDRVDFLKIDAEGFDLAVLKGVPWAKIKPEVILCEFEDAKTVKLGHCWTDIATYLAGHGYTIYVSEWYPVVRYGVRHDWRGMNRYPCALNDVGGWGNLLAFQTDPGEGVIRNVLKKMVKIDSQNGGGTKEKTSRQSGTPYIRFAEWLKGRSLPLFRMGQITMRVFRFLRRHPGVAFLGGVVLVSLILIPVLLQPLDPYMIYYLMVGVLVVMLACGALGVAWVKGLMDDFAKRELHARQSFKKELFSDLTQATRRAELLTKELASTPDCNFGAFQSFNRKLTKDHIDLILKEWAGKLELNLTPIQLSYMAHRIATLESNSFGRLATTIEDAVLRTLVVVSAKGDTLNVLEIGTLFGIGLGMIYGPAKARFASVHLIAIDPLDGYYGKGSVDLTGQQIDEPTFRRNLAKADVPESDYTLIKALSTDQEALSTARKKVYDVLIIDGDHTLDGVKSDFLRYSPLVKEGGYIVFDDYQVANWPDVQSFVDSEVAQNPNLSHVGTTWRTAVYRVLKQLQT